MTLQLALILVGLVIVVIVVLSSFDRARTDKRFHDARLGQANIRRVAKEALALIDRTFRSAAGHLDINPGPIGESKKRFLKSDDPLPEKKTKEEPTFYDSLESYEQVASIPLEVDTAGATIWPENELDDGVENNIDERVIKRCVMPDPQTDFIIDLPGKNPVSRNVALGIYKQHEYMLEKPRSLFGLRYVEGVWSNIDQDPDTTQYGDLFLAIQLIDAKGPIKESELNTFGQLGLKMADGLNRPSKMSMTFEQAVEKARELDELCKKCDAIASINVSSAEDKEFPGAAIKEVASAQGLEFGEMEIFHKKNNDAVGCRHMFSMANLYEPGTFSIEQLDTQTVRGLTLFMHIPCTTTPVTVFEQMAETARILSEELEGTMVDHDGKVLTESGLAAIRHQIEDMADSMYDWGIPPGSETALRLFNQ
jgi:cell division protein ZipA